MRTILFASLILATFLFAKPFIVFPEWPVEYPEVRAQEESNGAFSNAPYCELSPPDVDNSGHSLVAIGVQKHISGNRCSAELLYVIRDSLEQFHAGDKFITNCGKTYSTGLQFFSGREIRYKKNYYERSNIFLIELNYNLSQYIYYPGAYAETWNAFMVPAPFPIGYITCPMGWRTKMDSIKEDPLYDIFAYYDKIYIYGTPYQATKPDPKTDSLLIKAERLLKLQGRDPKKFFDRLLSNRDSIRVTKFSRPYVAMGAIHAMREKVSGKDTLCEIDFKSYYTFKDSLCQSKYPDNPSTRLENPCNLYTGQPDFSWPYTSISDPNYNAYKKGACFPAKDFKFNRYAFGTKKANGKIRIDTLFPLQDFLYNEGDLIDLRMGFSISEMLREFYPADYSYDDAHFFDIVYFNKEKLDNLQLPERQRKEIIDGAKRVFKYCNITDSIRF